MSPVDLLAWLIAPAILVVSRPGAAENRCAPDLLSTRARTGSIVLANVKPVRRLFNGLRDPMERKDLSITMTEKIPLRSTLHQRTGMFRLLLPPLKSPEDSSYRSTRPLAGIGSEAFEREIGLWQTTGMTPLSRALSAHKIPSLWAESSLYVLWCSKA